MLNDGLDCTGILTNHRSDERQGVEPEAMVNMDVAAIALERRGAIRLIEKLLR